MTVSETKNLYYVTDLFPQHVPPGIDSSLTINGFLSHGPKRFPNEWSRIEGSREARGRLKRYVKDTSKPDDGMLARMRIRLANGYDLWAAI